MYGPNTNPGGGSYIFIAECQARYITDLLVRATEAGVGSLECRQDVHDEFNRQVDEQHGRMVWSHPGMETYYRNPAGRGVTNWPGRPEEGRVGKECVSTGRSRGGPSN